MANNDCPSRLCLLAHILIIIACLLFIGWLSVDFISCILKEVHNAAQ